MSEPDASTTAQRCALVAFAPGWIVEDLRKVRARCAPSGVPVRDAGVTLKGDFLAPRDPASIREAIARAVEGYPPFTVRTREPVVLERRGQADVLLPLEPSRPLDELHDRLVAALRRFVGADTHPSDAPGAYRPHVTVVHGIPLDGVEQTVKAIIGWRVNYFWTVRDVELVCLASDKVWRRIEPFHFGKPLVPAL